MLNITSNETESGCPHITNAEMWFNTIFLSMITLLTLIGNAIALYAFFVSPELKKITYYFIASLCISDTMIALTSIPMWVVHTHTCWKNTPEFRTLSNVYLAIDIFCGTWSIMSLAMISIERFVCIKYALHYYRIITKKRAFYMLIFAFLYSAVVMCIEIAIDLKRVEHRKTYESMHDRKPRTDIMVLQLLVVCFSYFLPVIIKLVSYQKIYSEASRQNNQIRSLRRYTNNNNNDSNDADVPEDSSSSDSKLPINSTSILKQTIVDATTRVSWTVSPLGRKRQCTQERIKVLDDLNEEDSICSDDDAEKTSRFGIIRLPGVLGKFIGNSNRKNKKLKHDGSVKSNAPSQEFDAKRPSYSLPLLQSRQTKENIDVNDSSSDDETSGNQIKSSSLQEKANILVCFEDNRKRSVSCPAYTPSLTRKSLEPNDIYTSIDNRSSGRKFTPTSSPLFQRLRAASKWSPANSPSLFRKSTRNRNDTKRREQKIRRFKKELRAAKVVGLIMGTFLFCWTPFMILVLLDAANVVIEVRPVMIAKDLHYLNSTLNPVLYVVLNKVYRQAVWKSLRKLKLYLHNR